MALPGAIASGQAATVEVDVEGIEPVTSRLYVALCQGGLTETECRIGQDDPVRGTGQRVVFRGVQPGVYAVAAFQDVNGNGKLDRTGLGLPLEPYGFSGEVARRARPEFESAAFALREPGASLRVRLSRALPPR
ncbi:MAG: DUF2141 domain-containing protein [Methylobacterium sp.]|uniref:DUF2141 domain-containing protein n=1 Tax=Methylobacterium sp. TaxID=409 RepID=UPI0025FA8271|nr:DUF2141 domain-containing protein [Methylobacterium sp.]MBX9933920.1 DUF2141 domain-containing protein [Methylobacterium sp.]